MGISYVFKKFTPQDKAIVPFNAYKQYNFTSASAASNQVTYYPTSYTSESVSLYSSASAPYGGDTKNVVKYNQIDHLFYRDNLKKYGTKKEPIHYLKNQRNLYEKAHILSIPTGLYGSEIKKNTFYLSSSNHKITEDSFGNLIISGTNIDNYPNDVQENVFKLGPVKGFKKYDLGVYDGYAIVEGREFNGSFQYIHKEFYRQGLTNAGAPTTYTSNNESYPKGYYPKDEDDSYFFNELNYNKVTFQKSTLGPTLHRFPTIDFNSVTSSYIKIPHNSRFNFNTNEDFAISFWIKPESTASSGNISNTEKRYIIAKSTTKTTPSLRETPGDGSGSVLIDTTIGAQFPYEIYMMSQSLYFARSDGKITNTISEHITASGGTCQRNSHILCQLTSSIMEIYFDGTKIASTTSSITKNTRNEANLYIGSKGKPNTTMLDDTGGAPHRTFNGQLNNINIWSKAFSPTQINNISESVNASPYIGNIFYKNGFATITHPNYYDVVSGSSGAGTIDTLQFQGTHLIYEHEYQCTVQEYEFNNTTNTSVRKNTGTNPYELESFTSSSFFKPYVTTIGLYNKNHELLVIGKLGQPIRMSDETDTTFVVRWDT